MADLQERMKTLPDVFQLASFSVDPEHDTPAVLAAYGQKYGREPGRWSFVTGPMDAVTDAITGGFKIAIERSAADGGAEVPNIVHGEQFVLLDQSARIRGYYHRDPQDLARMLSDAQSLLAGERR